jgi:hypothetical protein
VSEEDVDKKDLDKGVRALTTLTKDHEIPTLTADFFDSKHPLPAVCASSFATFLFIRLIFLFITCLMILRLAFVQGHQFFVSRPPLLEGGPIQTDHVSAASEAPEAEDSQDGDDAEDSLEGTSSTMSPLPAHSEDPSLDRKRKHVEELVSLSTSASRAAIGEPLAPNDDIEIFDLLDS